MTDKQMDEIIEKLTVIGDKVDNLDQQLQVYRQRLERVEKMKEQHDESVRPRKGNPIVPNLYRRVSPTLSATATMTEEIQPINLSALLTEPLIDTLGALNEAIIEGEGYTEDVVNKLDLSRSTVSYRLNQLFKLRLVTKIRGKKAKWAITPDGELLL